MKGADTVVRCEPTGSTEPQRPHIGRIRTSAEREDEAERAARGRLMADVRLRLSAAVALIWIGSFGVFTRLVSIDSLWASPLASRWLCPLGWVSSDRSDLSKSMLQASSGWT